MRGGWLLGLCLLALVLVPIALWVGADVARPQSCERAANGLPVVVDLANDRHATLIAHERAAIDRGQPRLLTWDPAGADVRRRQDLRGIPTLPGADRDEYPPASTRESGLQPDGSRADVAYVPSSENRSGGQLLGHAMAGYCSGQRLVIEAGRP